MLTECDYTEEKNELRIRTGCVYNLHKNLHVCTIHVHVCVCVCVCEYRLFVICFANQSQSSFLLMFLVCTLIYSVFVFLVCVQVIAYLLSSHSTPFSSHRKKWCIYIYVDTFF